MSKPICCGKNTMPYKKEWLVGTRSYSWEEGFRCKVCKQIRIPFSSNIDTSYMDSLDKVRRLDIEWVTNNLNQSILPL
jgi:hypothetical protein